MTGNLTFPRWNGRIIENPRGVATRSEQSGLVGFGSEFSGRDCELETGEATPPTAMNLSEMSDHVVTRTCDLHTACDILEYVRQADGQCVSVKFLSAGRSHSSQRDLAVYGFYFPAGYRQRWRRELQWRCALRRNNPWQRIRASRTTLAHRDPRLIVLFEAAVVLVLRTHYTDVFTGIVVALYAAYLADKLSLCMNSNQSERNRKRGRGWFPLPLGC